MKASAFSRVLCLNLDRRPDRWDGFSARWKAVEDWPFPPVERYSAVDGFDSVPAPGWWRERPGAWGCMASYLRILRELAATHDEAWLFLEDDAMFKRRFYEDGKAPADEKPKDHLSANAVWSAKAIAYLDRVPDDWEICYLGGLHWDVYRHPATPINRRVILPDYMSGTHGWGVRRSFVETLINYLETPFCPGDEGLQQIDQRLAALQRERLYPIYAPFENLVGQAENISDISGLIVGPCYWDLLSDVTGRWGVLV